MAGGVGATHPAKGRSRSRSNATPMGVDVGVSVDLDDLVLTPLGMGLGALLALFSVFAFFLGAFDVAVFNVPLILGLMLLTSRRKDGQRPAWSQLGVALVFTAFGLTIVGMLVLNKYGPQYRTYRHLKSLGESRLTGVRIQVPEGDEIVVHDDLDRVSESLKKVEWVIEAFAKDSPIVKTTTIPIFFKTADGKTHRFEVGYCGTRRARSADAEDGSAHNRRVRPEALLIGPGGEFERGGHCLVPGLWLILEAQGLAARAGVGKFDRFEWKLERADTKTP